MPDPLRLRILCSKCGNLLTGPPPCGHHLGIDRTALGDELRQCDSVEFEPYIPLRFVPEELIEELRAKELEANMKGGNRKLTDEEKARAIPGTARELTDEERAAIQELENEGGPVAPSTGSEVPPELLEDEGFSG